MIELEVNELRNRINELLTDQRLAVLSSNMNDQPYTNLIAFAHSEDLNFSDRQVPCKLRLVGGVEGHNEK